MTTKMNDKPLPKGPLWMRAFMMGLFLIWVVYLTWLFAKAYDAIIAFLGPML